MDIVITITGCILLNFLVIGFITNQAPSISKKFLWILYAVHIILSIVYLIYASLTASDSVAYFKTASSTTDWSSLFNTGSTFIRFLAWPFCNILNLSYYSLMVVFSNFGYFGIILFYSTLKENIRYKNSLNSYSTLEWVFLLPNVHFWSSSLGKGSMMIFGLGLLFYGISRFNYRFIHIVIGSFIVYFTRPHILFTCIVGVAIGLLFSGKGISKTVKYSLIVVSFIAVYFLTDKVLEFTESDSLNILDSNTILHRAQELGKSSSGVDISNYNVVSKMLTFWFRPLFIDATGLMGFLVSFENVVLVVMILSIIKTFVTNLKKFNGFYLSCLFAFVLGSFVLAQVSGNLGIALRQKAQIMPLFFIIYAKCIEFKQRQISRA
jgi:hypothetical protein